MSARNNGYAEANHYKESLFLRELPPLHGAASFVNYTSSFYNLHLSVDNIMAATYPFFFFWSVHTRYSDGRISLRFFSVPFRTILHGTTIFLALLWIFIVQIFKLILVRRSFFFYIFEYSFCCAAFRRVKDTFANFNAAFSLRSLNAYQKVVAIYGLWQKFHFILLLYLAFR